jgi:hypothetical protein
MNPIASARVPESCESGLPISTFYNLYLMFDAVGWTKLPLNPMTSTLAGESSTTNNKYRKYIYFTKAVLPRNPTLPVSNTLPSSKSLLAVKLCNTIRPF